MNHATRELEQQLLRIAIMLILIDSVIHILLGQLILQFKGDDRQTVDKHAKIQRQLCFVRRKMQLPGYAENVLCIQFSRSRIVDTGRHIEHDEAGRICLDALAQHINNAAFGNLIAHPGQELCLFLRIGFQLQLINSIRLRILQKAEKAHCIKGIFHAVVMVMSLLIAVVFYQPLHNQAFKSGFACIGKHRMNLLEVGQFRLAISSTLIESRMPNARSK